MHRIPLPAIALVFVQATMLCVSSALAGPWNPLELWMPVTFYDFRADGTNPNFEPAAYSDTIEGVRPGMVGAVLDSIRKPSLGIDRAFNEYIDHWYRPSGISAANYFVVTRYSRGTWSGLNPCGPDEWCGPYASEQDPMANRVIYDSLLFTRPSDTVDVYEYVNEQFFPLDGRGYGAQPQYYAPYDWTNDDGHNFGFTMELHCQVTSREGMVLRYGGDDDLWVFINDTLRLDLGGFHGLECGEVHPESLGIAFGEKFHLDVFYATTHVTSKSIHLSAAPLSECPPCALLLRQLSPYHSTVSVDSGVVLSAVIESPCGAPSPDFNDSISWRIVPPGDSTASLSDTTGGSVTFTPHRADTEYRVAVWSDMIYGSFPDCYFPCHCRDTFVVYSSPQLSVRLPSRQLRIPRSPTERSRAYYDLRGSRVIESQRPRSGVLIVQSDDGLMESGVRRVFTVRGWPR